MGKKRNTWTIVIAVVLLVIGVGMLLQSSGMMPPFVTRILNSILNFWPVVLILLGLSMLVGKKERRSYFGGFILLLLGFAILGANLGWWTWAMVGPAAIVGIGLGLLLNAIRN